jgi:hypothetical protein
MPIVRYVVSMSVLMIALTTIEGLVQGLGLIGLIGGALGIVWSGWVVLVAGLPPFGLFLILLPRAIAGWPNQPIPIVAVTLSTLIWAVTGAILVALAMATNSIPVNPPLIVAGQVALVITILGLIGAGLGLVEGLIRRREVDQQ